MEINGSVAETKSDSAPERPKKTAASRARIHVKVARSWKKSKTKALESPRMHIQKDE